jgi:hypothetical protein
MVHKPAPSKYKHIDAWMIKRTPQQVQNELSKKGPISDKLQKHIDDFNQTIRKLVTVQVIPRVSSRGKRYQQTIYRDAKGRFTRVTTD